MKSKGKGALSKLKFSMSNVTPSTVTVTSMKVALMLALAVKNVYPPSAGLLSSSWRSMDVIVGRNGGVGAVETGSNAAKDPLIEVAFPNT